jgi:predicted phosphoribosyltransferase
MQQRRDDARASEKVADCPELRNRTGVFADRKEAGAVLAGLVRADLPPEAVILAIPAGGLPVAASLAGELELAYDVLAVSKITLPWNTEVGYGAVAFDGTVRLNDPLIRRMGLDHVQVQQGIVRTVEKVQRRMQALRGRGEPDVRNAPAVLVDDGLASGFTMLAAAEAALKLGAREIHVAVPTASGSALAVVSGSADRVYCANLREGPWFAVADAYRRWREVSETEAAEIARYRPVR